MSSVPVLELLTPTLSSPTELHTATLSSPTLSSPTELSAGSRQEAFRRPSGGSRRLRPDQHPHPTPPPKTIWGMGGGSPKSCSRIRWSSSWGNVISSSPKLCEKKKSSCSAHPTPPTPPKKLLLSSPQLSSASQPHHPSPPRQPPLPQYLTALFLFLLTLTKTSPTLTSPKPPKTQSLGSKPKESADLWPPKTQHVLRVCAQIPQRIHRAGTSKDSI